MLAELEMLSQVSAASTGSSTPSTDDDIGGRRPSGGIDRRDDKDVNVGLKSADHFRVRFERCHSDRMYMVILDEAREVVSSWKRTPIPPGDLPAYGSPQWKRWVAETNGRISHGEIARRFNVTRQYVIKLRRDWGVET